MADTTLKLEPGISEDVIAIFRANGVRRTYQKNQLIVTAGDDFEEMFIIDEGRFSYSNIDRHGNASVYGYKEVNSIWGLAGALMNTPASFFFEAVEESVATCVSHAVLWRLIDESAEVRRAVIYRLGWAVFEATSFGHQERTLPLKRRLALFLVKNADDDGILELPQAVLARNLGVSRYAVGTQLQTLKRQCLIEIEYGRVRVIDSDQLKAFGAPF